MSREEFKCKILSKLDTQHLNWGKLCNQIQDIAETLLSDESWNAYIKCANRDLGICQGSDFLTINGHYWDWKEFDTNTVPIVSAFLDYFNVKDLNIIAEHIKERR